MAIDTTDDGPWSLFQQPEPEGSPALDTDGPWNLFRPPAGAGRISAFEAPKVPEAPEPSLSGAEPLGAVRKPEKWFVDELKDEINPPTETIRMPPKQRRQWGVASKLGGPLDEPDASDEPAAPDLPSMSTD